MARRIAQHECRKWPQTMSCMHRQRCQLEARPYSGTLQSHNRDNRGAGPQGSSCTFESRHSRISPWILGRISACVDSHKTGRGGRGGVEGERNWGEGRGGTGLGLGPAIITVERAGPSGERGLLKGVVALTRKALPFRVYIHTGRGNDASTYAGRPPA